jgi:ArsR family transcriptional regulator, lead/cadmium/zinc/bismuth-responsive transcriptional repressor
MLTKKEIQKNRKIFSETDKSTAAMFKVLSDVNRYRIFRILAEQPKLSVSNIARILDISLPLTSQHLRILTHANLLQKERDGKKIYPKLEQDNPFVRAIVQTIQQILNLNNSK